MERRWRLLGKIDALCLRFVFCEAGYTIAYLEGGAAFPVEEHLAEDAVARGERGFFLEGIGAAAHVDVGAGDDGVVHGDLDLPCGGSGRSASTIASLLSSPNSVMTTFLIFDMNRTSRVSLWVLETVKRDAIW